MRPATALQSAAPLLAPNGATLTKSETFSASNFRHPGLQNSMPNPPISGTCTSKIRRLGASKIRGLTVPKSVASLSKIRDLLTPIPRPLFYGPRTPCRVRLMCMAVTRRGRARSPGSRCSSSAIAKRLALDGASSARATLRPST